MCLNSLLGWSPHAYFLNKLETIPDVPTLLEKLLPIKLPFTILISITEIYLLFYKLETENIFSLCKN